MKYIFVAPNHRKQGIGAYIIQNLMQESTKPIYGQPACGKALFYVRFGFVPIRLKQLSPEIKSDLRRAGIGEPLLMYDRNPQ